MKLRIRDLREDLDKTQAEIAHYLGCCQQTYSRYESGKSEPSLEIMERLSIYFHTSVDYLLGLTDEKAPYPRKRT